MNEKRKLSVRQLAVIDDIFGGELGEQQVLEKNGLSRNLYSKWLSDEAFADEFERRITSAVFQSRAIIAKYSLVAAARLVALTESENPETARKACLDIISLPGSVEQAKQTSRPADSDLSDVPAEISAELAERLLATLAEPKKSV